MPSLPCNMSTLDGYVVPMGAAENDSKHDGI